jgi:hypothetical protein
MTSINAERAGVHRELRQFFALKNEYASNAVSFDKSGRRAEEAEGVSIKDS